MKKMRVRAWPIVAGVALFGSGIGIGVAGRHTTPDPVATTSVVENTLPVRVSISTAPTTVTATVTETTQLITTAGRSAPPITTAATTVTVTLPPQTVTRINTRIETITVVAPETAPAQTSEQTQIRGLVDDSTSVYFSSCAEARAAGAAPLYRGQPGYRAGLDRDNDGVACE